MRVINIIAWILLIIGGINWLLVGLFGFNLVDAIFGSIPVLASIIYSLVGLSAIWLIFSPIYGHGKISLWNRD